MTYIEDLEKKIDRLKEIAEAEKNEVLIVKVKKPSRLEEFLSFDYSQVDTLQGHQLEQYLGGLSQYLIYLNKYINQLTIAYLTSKGFYESALSKESLKYKDLKTISDRQTQAIADNPELEKINEVVFTYESRLAIHKNSTDTIRELIQTLKKVYDARIKESIKPE